jgi:protein O-GlcNAc transferase
MNTEDFVRIALEHEKAGRLPQADLIWKTLLKKDPQQPDALRALASRTTAATTEPPNPQKTKTAAPVIKTAPKALPARTPKKKARSQQEEMTYLEEKRVIIQTAFKEGRFEDVKTEAEALTQSHPDLFFGWKALGAAYFELGMKKEAAQCIQKSLSLNPNDAEAYSNLGGILVDINQFSESERACKKAIKINQYIPQAYYNLGNAFIGKKIFSKAGAAFIKAIQLKKDYYEAFLGIGIAFEKTDRAESIVFLEKALLSEKTRSRALLWLGKIFYAEGFYEKSRELINQSLSENNKYLIEYSAALFYQNLFIEKKENLLLSAKKYEEIVNSSLNFVKFKKWKHLNGKIKVGFISGDFYSHAVSTTIHFLKEINRKKFLIVAYSNTEKEKYDQTTAILKSYFYEWNDISELSDSETAEKIHGDGICILIDLSGHTEGSRLPVLARKPAPVQATWIGYMGTRGLSAIDYIISDKHVIPPEEESDFVEKPWHMKKSFSCFSAQKAGLNFDVSVQPFKLNKKITFGSLNKLMKLNDHVLDLWCAVLRYVPESQILICAFNFYELPEEIEKTYRRFESRGVSRERVCLEDWDKNRLEYISLYNKIDIALNPFPYGGGTITVEAIWMGVPVLTKRGDRYLSRITDSVLHNVGLEEWIAEDEEDYIRKALAFASDPEKLGDIRNTLRERALASPMFNETLFARDFEDAMQGMWGTWLSNNPDQNTEETQ